MQRLLDLADGVAFALPVRLVTAEAELLVVQR